MIRIINISCDDYSAEASVEMLSSRNSVPENYTVSILPEEFTYCVYDGSENCREKYKCLSRCAESEFFSVFIVLRRMMNMFRPLITGETTADRTEDSRVSFTAEGETYSALELFRCDGKDYAAYILYDFSGNPPEFTFYLMQGKNNRIVEEYHEYYELVESEFFHVFARLENQMNDWMEERKNG